MSVFVRLDKAGAVTIEPSEAVYNISWSDSGVLSVRYDVDGSNIARNFETLNELNSFMRSFNGLSIDPEKAGLIYYLSKNAKRSAMRYEAGFAVHPLPEAFRVFAINGTKPKQLFTGSFIDCKLEARKFARMQGTRGGRMSMQSIYRNAAGAVIPDERGAMYRLDQYSNSRWKLYNVGEGVPGLVHDGAYEECQRLMFIDIERHRKASPPSIPAPVAESQCLDMPEEPGIEGQHKTRNRAKSVQAFYYADNLQCLEEYSLRAKYKVHLTDKGVWRVSKRDKNSGRFSWIEQLTFSDQDAALAYLYLYVGSVYVEFYDKDWKSCRFDTALYCRRLRNDDSMMEIQKFDGVSWNVIATGTPDSLVSFRDESPEAFYDGALQPCEAGEATYKELTVTYGILCKFFELRDGSWVHIRTGTPEEIRAFRESLRAQFVVKEAKAEHGPEVSQGSSEKGMYNDAVAHGEETSKSERFEGELRPKKSDTRTESKQDLVELPNQLRPIWDKVKSYTWIRKGDFAPYLAMCAARNRSLGKTPVFNSKLHDVLNQSIYVFDRGFKKSCKEDIKMSDLVFCFSLPQVQRLCPEITELPTPIQFAQDLAQYLWDPTIPIYPINQHTLEHICVDRITRFPKELQNTNPATLMTAIRQSLYEEVEHARRDPFYALPCYSREYDEVTMLLPIRIPLLFGDKVIATLVLGREQTGYRVGTVLNLNQSCKSVALFRDPRTTWLKECYENG